MAPHVGERESHVRVFDMIETTALRARLGAAIEALVDLLDSIEPDADLEPDNDDEPSLGWCDGAHEARYGGLDDREVEDENDEDNGDHEPSLGWAIGGERGNTDDREGGDDPREFSWCEGVDQRHLEMGARTCCEDSEPSLAAPEGIFPGPNLHWDGYRWSRAKDMKRFRMGSQVHWAQQNSMTDAEEEFDGREDDDAREIEHEAGEDELWPCE